VTPLTRIVEPSRSAGQVAAQMTGGWCGSRYDAWSPLRSFGLCPVLAQVGFGHASSQTRLPNSRRTSSMFSAVARLLSEIGW
jgi:hypothetical protein